MHAIQEANIKKEKEERKKKGNKIKERAKTKKQFVSIAAFSSYNSLMRHKCSKHCY